MWAAAAEAQTAPWPKDAWLKVMPGPDGTPYKPTGLFPLPSTTAEPAAKAAPPGVYGGYYRQPLYGPPRLELVIPPALIWTRPIVPPLYSFPVIDWGRGTMSIVTCMGLVAGCTVTELK